MNQTNILSDKEALLEMQKSLVLNPLQKFHVNVLKLRYQLWLALLREVSILKVLTENYNKIPKTAHLSRLLAWLFKSFKPAKILLSKAENRLRKRIY